MGIQSLIVMLSFRRGFCLSMDTILDRRPVYVSDGGHFSRTCVAGVMRGAPGPARSIAVYRAGGDGDRPRPPAEGDGPADHGTVPRHHDALRCDGGHTGGGRVSSIVYWRCVPGEAVRNETTQEVEEQPWTSRRS